MTGHPEHGIPEQIRMEGLTYTHIYIKIYIKAVIFMGINMLDMKQNNAQTVLSALRSGKTSTIKDMAQRTGLSFATVGNVLNGFVERGEVILGEMHSATGGRPSQAYTYNAEYAHVLALSARIRNGENIISACIENLYGEAVWQTEKCFDTIQLNSFETMIETSLEAYPTISIVACSLPGIEQNGVILTNDYTELEGISFKEYFQTKYQLSVVIENDVNAAVLGYGRNAEAVSVLVGIYFPRFFGPGVLYGDFFTDTLKEAIINEIPVQAIRNIFPSIDYNGNIDSDIITGLFDLALSAYQSGLQRKFQPIQ